MNRTDSLARIAYLTHRLDRTPDELMRKPLLQERNDIEQRIGGYRPRDDQRVHRLLKGFKDAERMTA